MEPKQRSWEFIAIPTTLVVLGILAILMWAAGAGLWAWLAVGIVGVTAVVIVAIASMRRPHHPTAAPAPAPAHVDDGVHRLLLVADASCDPGTLGKACGADAKTEVFVVAPSLGSRTARWTGDDHAYQEAQRHLDETLRSLSSLGIDSRGHIGSHDPLQAADDGLREFPADEIVFAVEAGDGNWLEQGVIDAAKARYGIPVRELTVGA